MSQFFCIFKMSFCNSLEFLLEKLILLFKRTPWFCKLCTLQGKGAGFINPFCFSPGAEGRILTYQLCSLGQIT